MRKSSWKYRGLVVAGLVLGLVMPAQAALVGVLPATPGQLDFQAYYDDHLDITWAANANINGIQDNWINQMAWAAGLDIGGVTGWRLPTTLVPDTSCAPAASQPTGFGCQGSEMGHLYYTELLNPINGPLLNTGPFSNVQASFYWSGTEFAPNTNNAWNFNFNNGNQNANNKNNNNFAWAVHSGA